MQKQIKNLSAVQIFSQRIGYMNINAFNVIHYSH